MALEHMYRFKQLSKMAEKKANFHVFAKKKAMRLLQKLIFKKKKKDGTTLS